MDIQSRRNSAAYAAKSLERDGYDSTASKVANGVVQLNPRDKFPESWICIPPLKGNAKEYMGYPTQKPEALLERIIKASSNKGEVVLDPFCGCGTTVVAAAKLKRQFVGIDISHFAIDIVRERRLKDKKIRVYGFPVDIAGAERLARDAPFEFEKWAVTRIPGMVPNKLQVGDGGIDGRGTIHGDGSLVLAQVKGGRNDRLLGHVRDSGMFFPGRTPPAESSPHWSPSLRQRRERKQEGPDTLKLAQGAIRERSFGLLHTICKTTVFQTSHRWRIHTPAGRWSMTCSFTKLV